jgi:DNA-binding Xre family transcriptional regulator
MDRKVEGRPRRSAGMRGTPRNDAPEHRPISTTPPAPRSEPKQPQRISNSPHAKPKVLMGEVAMPRGLEIGKQRDAFRAFMIARHLRPSEWARAAGVPSGEILGFLTGKTRSIAPQTLEKLATAANCTPQDFFR